MSTMPKNLQMRAEWHAKSTDMAIQKRSRLQPRETGKVKEKDGLNGAVQ